MAKTVSEAFDKFVREVVDLDATKVALARDSIRNLIANIREFDDDEEFFKLYTEVDVGFGSFARGTKCRALDDVDLMIGLNARGTTYQGCAKYDNIEMYVGGDPHQQDCVNRGTNVLNSTKVINKFVAKLASTRDYCRSEIHKNQAAAVLNLKSKDWSFDIVPCFYTTQEQDGRQYYLIPNGKGNWMKTDPRLDDDALRDNNARLNGWLRPLIRLMKRWNRTKRIATLQSYLLETLLLDVTIGDDVKYLRTMMYYALDHLANKICHAVNDSKGIQGDLNALSVSDRMSIKDRATADRAIVADALNLEYKHSNHEAAINKWRAVFGEDFPAYG